MQDAVHISHRPEQALLRPAAQDPRKGRPAALAKIWALI